MRDFDELFHVMGRGGSTSMCFDFFALVFFIVFAIVYLVAPVIGYQHEGRSRIVMSLYALIGYIGMSLAQAFIFLIETIDPGGPFGRGGVGGNGGFFRILVNDVVGFGGNGMLVFFLFITFVKIVLLVVSMVLFVSGLLSLRLRP